MARTRSESSTSAALRRSREVHSSRGRCSDDSLTGVAVAPTARMPESDTAIVRSASAAAVGSIGIGLMRPPSTSTRPLMTAGVMTPGMAIEARIAFSTGPRWNHTSRRALMSVATAVKGIGRLSIVAPSRISPTLWMIRSARIAPPGAVIDRSSSRHTSRWLRLRAHSVYSSSLPGRGHPADERAHGRSCDRDDLEPALAQHLDDADVGIAASAARPEDECCTCSLSHPLDPTTGPPDAAARFGGRGARGFGR